MNNIPEMATGQVCKDPSFTFLRTPRLSYFSNRFFGVSLAPSEETIVCLFVIDFSKVEYFYISDKTDIICSTKKTNVSLCTTSRPFQPGPPYSPNRVLLQGTSVVLDNLSIFSHVEKFSHVDHFSHVETFHMSKIFHKSKIFLNSYIIQMSTIFHMSKNYTTRKFSECRVFFIMLNYLTCRKFSASRTIFECRRSFICRKFFTCQKFSHVDNFSLVENFHMSKIFDMSIILPPSDPARRHSNSLRSVGTSGGTST